MARTLAEIGEKYPAPPTADDPDSNAKDAVLGMLQLNTSLNGALLFYLGSQKDFFGMVSFWILGVFQAINIGYSE